MILVTPPSRVQPLGCNLEISFSHNIFTILNRFLLKLYTYIEYWPKNISINFCHPPFRGFTPGVQSQNFCFHPITYIPLYIKFWDYAETLCMCLGSYLLILEIPPSGVRPLECTLEISFSDILTIFHRFMLKLHTYTEYGPRSICINFCHPLFRGFTPGVQSQFFYFHMITLLAFSVSFWD